MSTYTTYECKICHKVVKRGRSNGNRGNVCNSCRQKYRKIQMKQKAIDYLGGKCSVCGYDKCMDAFDFHHIDESTKEFNISLNFNLAWEKLKNELDKCELLCANCHREIHAQDNSKFTTTNFRKYVDFKDNKLSAEKRKAKELEKTARAKEKEDKFKFILDCVYNSGIDYSKPCWSEELAKLIGYTRQSAMRWVRRNVPRFYAENCHKVERVNQSDIDEFIELYNNGVNIVSIAYRTGFCLDTISKYLHAAGIEVKQNNFKHVGMYKDDKLIKDFSSLGEAGRYIETNFKISFKEYSRDKITTKDFARTKIARCVNHKQKSAYGYVWKEIA